jgi:hypothetical protein
MAYGKKYTITQKTHDCVDLVVDIYEKDYSGSVTSYQAVSVVLQPNSSEEDPIGTIISSELNVSFTISTEADYANFLDLLDYDDTKYYIELVIEGVVKWKGFLFNDYAEVGFAGGTQQVAINAIDGLSLLRYSFFDGFENTNENVKLLDIIGTCLNKLQFKDTSFFYSLCSYYAEGMFDRGDAVGNEPFSQTYQFKRDFVGLDYYTVLDNIIKSFGCRLFQANGDWYILPMNQMATTLYYTRYVVEDTPTVSGSGIFVNNITIQPYVEGNVHFAGGDQVKIVKKGYPTIQAEMPFQSATNYIYNGTFKNTSSTFVAAGWHVTRLSSPGFPLGTVLFINSDDAQLNLCQMAAGPGREASISNKFPGPTGIYEYTPMMYGPGASLSYELRGRFRVYISILVGSTTYYLNDSDEWITTETFRDSGGGTNLGYETKTISIPLGISVGGTIRYEGYVNVEFRAVDGAPGGFLRNIKLTQNTPAIQAVVITRKIEETNAVGKSIDIPYGIVYEPSNTINDLYNNVGLLVDEDRNPLTNWYSYSYPALTYESLPYLIMRQYSNLLNRNIATLEGNLGAYESTAGLIYLDKIYMVEDSSTGAMTYNGKKFLINRLDLDAANVQVASIQLVEITNTNNESVQTVEYIGDIQIVKPKRYFQ